MPESFAFLDDSFEFYVKGILTWLYFKIVNNLNKLSVIGKLRLLVLVCKISRKIFFINILDRIPQMMFLTALVSH